MIFFFEFSEADIRLLSLNANYLVGVSRWSKR